MLYASAPSIGSTFTAVAVCDASVLGECVLGQKGTRAEEVGRKAAERLLASLATGAPLDAHMGDQIMPYLALAGGHVRVSAMSEHALANVGVINLFGYNLKADGQSLSSD